MINQEQLDAYRQKFNQLKIKVSPLEDISNASNLAENEYLELVEGLLTELQEVVEKNKKWERYFKPKGLKLLNLKD